MAEVKIKNLDKITKDLKKVFTDTKTQTRTLFEIGKFVRDRIVFEARSGYSLEGDKRKKFPALKESTVNRRKGLEKTNPFVLDDRFFKADRANVTLTGQLLDAFKFKIQQQNGKIIFFFKDLRKPIQSDDSTSNNEVYDNLKKLGFGFIGVDERSQKRVRKIVLDNFRRNIKKIF